jgi:hypothetical protein
MDWHDSEVPPLLVYISYWGKTGQHLLAVSFSQFDPLRTSGPISALQQRLTALTLGNDAKVFQPRKTVGRASARTS